MNRKTQLEMLENRFFVNPGDLQALKRLVTMLDAAPVRTNQPGHFEKAQAALGQGFGRNWQKVLLEPGQHAAAYERWLSVLNTAGIKRGVPIGQVFSGRMLTIRGEHAHCDTRLKFFKETKVISGLCNNCYKVQVLPETLEAMFQTYFLLLNLKLPQDNARKCMIELREGIKYPYKAYIYCESVADVKSCLSAFQKLQAEAGIMAIHSKISHGCSEYGLEYPGFKFSEEPGHEAFEMPKEWQSVEKSYFDKLNLPVPSRKTHTKPMISLRDVFAFRTWVKYASLIGDETCQRYHVESGPELPPAFVDRVRKQAVERRQEMIELASRT